MNGYSSAAGAFKVGQRGVPNGMVKVTRWGREGLKDGDWVMVGGKNRITWLLRVNKGHVIPDQHILFPKVHWLPR